MVLEVFYSNSQNIDLYFGVGLLQHNMY